VAAAIWSDAASRGNESFKATLTAASGADAATRAGTVVQAAGEAAQVVNEARAG
jgi:hypothetical protein